MALYDLILADSPVAYWTGGAATSGGTPYGWVDSSGNGLTLTTGKLATSGFSKPALAPAASQSSTLFTAANSEYLQRPHDIKFNLADTFTIEFWVGYRSYTGIQSVLFKGDAYIVRINTAAKVELVGPFGTIIATSSVALTGTHHVAITKSGATTRIYIDGENRTTAGTNVTLANNTTAFQTGTTFNSYISDLALYTVALSASKIAEHYAGSLPTYVKAQLDAIGSATGAAVRRGVAKPTTLAGITTANAGSVRRQPAGAPIEIAVTLAGAAIRRALAQATLDGILTTAATVYARRGAIAQLGVVATLTGNAAGRFAIGESLAGVLTMKVGRDLAGIPLPPVWLPPQIVAASDASDRLIQALAHSHQIALLIQILDPVTGEPAYELDTAITGTVTLDSGAAIRGRLDLELADDGLRNLIPEKPTDILTPYGTEIRVARGIRFPDGAAEVVSLGVFRVRTVDTIDTGDSLTIRIAGLDRWSRIADARFERTTIIPAGTNKMVAILQLAREVWPDVPYDLPATTANLTQQIAERGDDRGEMMRDIAASMGLEVFFDGTGTLTARPIAQATDTTRWHLTEGQDGLLLEAARGWDAERIYNKVIASGEPVDDVPPVCAQVWDNNPSSPTYFYGPFGQRPRFYVSGMLSTAAQAQTAAAGILAKAIGTSQKVDFGSIVNPAMEPGTVAQITRGRLGLDEKHVIDTLTIPLGATESMTGTTRLMALEDEG